MKRELNANNPDESNTGLKVSNNELKALGVNDVEILVNFSRVANGLLKHNVMDKTQILANLEALIDDPMPYALKKGGKFKNLAEDVIALRKEGKFVKQERNNFKLKEEIADFPVWGIEHIEVGALAQMKTAIQLPIAVAGALMPDAHQGYGLPIGGVLATTADEDDLFDVIEFLHDHCSKGLDGYYHSWNQCGYHYEKFSDQDGQKHFREVLNPILKEYLNGFEISDSGEILMLSDNGLSTLFEADIPTSDNENIKDKINSSILKFRRHRSTLEDRKEAVRELADVLEFLRPEIKKYLNKKDENDIFNIANNFGIRHHNNEQKTDYDRAIWYSWIFYFYLATIHSVLRMTKKNI